VGNLSVLITFHGFVPFFSMTKPVLFSFMSGSGISDLWPPPRLFWPFLCRLCVRFLIYVMIVLFSVRSVLCPVYMYCVHMYWHSLSSFFCSCPAPVFRIYDPPCIFWPFLSCFTSSCVVSVRISVRLFCVPSTCIVSCIWLSFTLQSFFYLLSCPASVFLSWLCISSCLLLYKRHLFCWIGTKTKFTSLRQYHFICTVL
jgi:hypothetical protein